MFFCLFLSILWHESFFSSADSSINSKGSESFCDNGNIPYLDCGGGYTTHLSNTVLLCMKYTSVKLV